MIVTIYYSDTIVRYSDDVVLPGRSVLMCSADARCLIVELKGVSCVQTRPERVLAFLWLKLWLNRCGSAFVASASVAHHCVKNQVF